jgi:hypothetical protein
MLPPEGQKNNLIKQIFNVHMYGDGGSTGVFLYLLIIDYTRLNLSKKK